MQLCLRTKLSKYAIVFNPFPEKCKFALRKLTKEHVYRIQQAVVGMSLMLGLVYRIQGKGFRPITWNNQELKYKVKEGKQDET